MAAVVGEKQEFGKPPAIELGPESLGAYTPGWCRGPGLHHACHI